MIKEKIEAVKLKAQNLSILFPVTTGVAIGAFLFIVLPWLFHEFQK